MQPFFEDDQIALDLRRARVGGFWFLNFFLVNQSAARMNERPTGSPALVDPHANARTSRFHLPQIWQE